MPQDRTEKEAIDGVGNCLRSALAKVELIKSTHLDFTKTVARGELRLGTSGRVRWIIPVVKEVTWACRAFTRLERREEGAGLCE